MWKRVFWYGGGAVPLVLLFVWLAWNGAVGPAPVPGGDAFDPPAAGTGTSLKDLLLYVALALLSVWIIALIVAAIVRMRHDRRDTETE